jgi:hypothetical protein
MLVLFGIAAAVAVRGSDSEFATRVLSQLRFSPNGRFVLAQGDVAVTVLALPSLQIVFRVEADPGVLAHFTPDSSGVVLVRGITQLDRFRLRVTHGPGRVERWSIPDGVRVAQFPLPELAYARVELAPDGKTLAADDASGTLHILDVGAGKELLTRQGFMHGVVTRLDPPVELPLRPENIDFWFSPDGRYALAQSYDRYLLWDNQTKSVVRMKGEATKLNRFLLGAKGLTADPVRMYTTAMTRLPGVAQKSNCGGFRDDGYREKIVYLSVPEGKEVSYAVLPLRAVWDPKMLQPSIREATDPAYLISSAQECGLFANDDTIMTAVWKYKTSVLFLRKSKALDVFGDHFVEERSPGEVALWDIRKGIRSSVVLPKR